MKQKLYRSEKNRVIFGVCGGLGKYFGIDPLLIRLIFVLLTIWGGSGIVIYALTAVLMPGKNGEKTEAAEEIGERVKDLVGEMQEPTKRGEGGKLLIGLLLVLWGGVEILKKYGWWRIDVQEVVANWWPVGVIAVGLTVIFGRKWWTVAVGFGLVWLAGWFILGNNRGFFR